MRNRRDLVRLENRELEGGRRWTSNDRREGIEQQIGRKTGNRPHEDGVRELYIAVRTLTCQQHQMNREQEAKNRKLY